MDTKKQKFDTKQLFDLYEAVENLKNADIFHLYDTKEECFKDNSGYHDSRHFILWAFNTSTRKKCNLGKHDGIENFSEENIINKIRVFADGSFMIRFENPVNIENQQCISLH